MAETTLPEPEESSQPKPPNVGKAGGIMMASLFLSRVLGLVREMVVAGKFGSSPLVGAFNVAFVIPDLLFFLIAGGALSSAFIPVFSEYLHTDREKDAWHVFSSVTVLMSVIILVLIAFAWVGAPYLIPLIAAKKDLTYLPLIVTMSRIVLPAQFAFFIGGLMFGTLYARQIFSIPGLGPNIYNIGIIFGAAVLASFVHPGVVGMSIGALVGALTGNLLVPILAMRKIGAHFRPVWDTKHPGVRKVFRLMLPVVLGLSLPGVYGIISRSLASKFYGLHVVAQFDYANKLMQVPLGIFGQSLAIAVFPALSQFFAQQRMDLYRKQVTSTMSTVIYLTFPIAGFLLVAPDLAVAAILQHGKFSASDTKQVAYMLQLFAFGIPAWCLHPVLMRAFFSVQKNVTPIVLGTITTGLFVALNLVLRLTPLGPNSLALASSISAIFLVLIMSWSLKRTVGELDLKPLFISASKSFLASGVAATIVWAMLQTPLGTMAHQGKLKMLLVAFFAFVVLGWIYYFITKKLGMPETGYVTRALARFKRQPSS